MLKWTLFVVHKTNILYLIILHLASLRSLGGSSSGFRPYVLLVGRKAPFRVYCSFLVLILDRIWSTIEGFCYSDFVKTGLWLKTCAHCGHMSTDYEKICLLNIRLNIQCRMLQAFLSAVGKIYTPIFSLFGNSIHEV